MIPGIGTLVNVAAVLVGALLGLLLGNRLPMRTREVVTDALGLVDPADRGDARGRPRPRPRPRSATAPRC